MMRRVALVGKYYLRVFHHNHSGMLCIVMMNIFLFNCNSDISGKELLLLATTYRMDMMSK